MKLENRHIQNILVSETVKTETQELKYRHIQDILRNQSERAECFPFRDFSVFRII